MPQSAIQWMLGCDLHTAVLSFWLHGQYAHCYHPIYLLEWAVILSNTTKLTITI